jgi:hypothetical protein
MGGELSARNEEVGGALFTVSVPLPDETATEGESAS